MNNQSEKWYDEFTSEDTVTVSCQCCYRKFEVSVFAFNESAHQSTKYCSVQCGISDLY